MRPQASPACVSTYASNPVVLNAATGCIAVTKTTISLNNIPSCIESPFSATGNLSQITTPAGPLSGQTLAFQLTNPAALTTTLNAVTDVAGSATVTFNSSLFTLPGSYGVQVSFAGTPTLAPSNSPIVIHVVVSDPVISAPTVTQPTCATPTATIVVNATGSGTLEYSIDNGSSWQLNATFSNLAPGSYNIKARGQGSTCVTSYINNPVILNAPACNGKTIPGRIEAESFDAKNGGQYAVPTNDAGGGQQLIGISNGSWMDYNVTVTQSGRYTVNFRVATTQNNTQFQIKLGNAVFGTVSIPNTGGWDTWQIATVNNILLTAGVQTIRIESINNETCNFNWMDWLFVSPATAPVSAAGLLSGIIPSNEKEDGMSVMIFPNPSSSFFNLKVQTKSMDQITVRVAGIEGRQLQQFQVMPGQAISFGDMMTNGMYLVEVRQGNERIVTKVIKQ